MIGKWTILHSNNNRYFCCPASSAKCLYWRLPEAPFFCWFDQRLYHLSAEAAPAPHGIWMFSCQSAWAFYTSMARHRCFQSLKLEEFERNTTKRDNSNQDIGRIMCLLVTESKECWCTSVGNLSCCLWHMLVSSLLSRGKAIGIQRRSAV